VLRPQVVLVLEDEQPLGLVAARLEEVRLVTSLGYRPVYSPLVRALTVVPGGDVVRTSQAAHAMAKALLASLSGGEADVVIFPSMRRDSLLYAEMSAAVPWLRRSHFAEVRTHRRLHLQQSLDDFLAARKRKVRAGVRYDAKRLEKRLGNRLRVGRFTLPEQLEQLFQDVPRIAELTYQKGLGAGFSDTPERRRLARLSLERGWFRAWVLYDEARPIAFWQGLVYNRVYHSATTGYDPEYGRDRVGIYLLIRVIAELCTDPAIDVFDFGAGDAEYKRHFSDEAWSEGDLLVFAPTFRAAAINANRTLVLGGAKGARRVIDRLGLTDRVKSQWRRRVRA
jgi:CelD/BcsL family acetyltransferase involved in cellulose biosynthesis